MKKVLAVLLTLVLVFGLCACGGGEDDANVINVGKVNCVDNVLSITAAIQVISAFVPELNGMDPNRDANNDYTDCVSTRV